VSAFGRYIKYYIKLEREEPAASSRQSQGALDWLMANQSRLSSQKHPKPIENPTNRKQELYNAVINFFKQEKMSSEVSSGLAQRTVKVLTDALWFVDGHQKT